MSFNKISLYDQFLISTTKINGPICEAHCVGGAHMSKHARRFQVRVHACARPHPGSRVARRRGTGHTGTHHALEPHRAIVITPSECSDILLEDKWGSGDAATRYSGSNRTSPVQTLDASVKTTFEKMVRAASSGVHAQLHTCTTPRGMVPT